MKGLIRNPSFLLSLSFTFLLILINSAEAGKILVLAIFGSKSHKITYMRLIEELAKRGHQITVVSPIKATKTVKNINEIFTFDVENVVFSQIDPLKMKQNKEAFNPMKMIGQFVEVCERSFQLPQVRALLNMEFDLIFIQPILNECALGIVHKLKAPLVIFTPTGVPDFLMSRLGTRLPTSFVPNMILDYTDEMSFWQRFVNLGITTVFDLGSRFMVEPVMERIYRRELEDETIPSIREILGNASLILSNGHFSLTGPRPYPPDVVDVGGMHSRPAEQLPPELEKFVSKNGSNGFIYFSMGSIINTDDMLEEKRQMFLRVFSKLKDFQIVWKWNSGSMPDKPENVFLGKWLPQQDLLGHRNIKMFITHCGGGGTEEAIYHEVPLLGLPIIGDQPGNAKQAKRLGFLLEMDWNELTEDSLMSSIQEVLFNPKYKENVKRLSTVFRDQPDDPLKRGVFWMEYVMRHKGAPQLRSAARKLYYFQYHSWDVIAAYVFILSSSGFIGFVTCKYCFRKVWSMIFSSSRKEVGAKSKKSK